MPPDHNEIELVHACPPPGAGVCPCCEQTPFELGCEARVSANPALVTCNPKGTFMPDMPDMPDTDTGDLDGFAELISERTEFSTPALTVYLDVNQLLESYDREDVWSIITTVKDLMA